MKLFASQIAQLTLANPTYRKFVVNLLELMYRSDIGSGDVTTRLLGNGANKKIHALVRAKQNGILAGVAEAEFFWRKHGIEVRSTKKDGARISRGEIVFELTGAAEKILTTERVVLNLLQRMSGIATATHVLVKKVGRDKIAATRKTPYGFLDSRAVVLGGGLPHRLNLADQILVKENHLALNSEIWRAIKTTQPFEIEADSEKFALRLAQNFRTSRNFTLLLDNFTPADLKKLVPKIRNINPKIILEASGGITPATIRNYLKTGVDYVSLGALTHSPKVLDLSLRISKNNLRRTRDTHSKPAK